MSRILKLCRALRISFSRPKFHESTPSDLPSLRALAAPPAPGSLPSSPGPPPLFLSLPSFPPDRPVRACPHRADAVSDQLSQRVRSAPRRIIASVSHPTGRPSSALLGPRQLSSRFTRVCGTRDSVVVRGSVVALHDCESQGGLRFYEV